MSPTTSRRCWSDPSEVFGLSHREDWIVVVRDLSEGGNPNARDEQTGTPLLHIAFEQENRGAMNPSVSNWSQVPGTFASVSIAADGSLWGLQTNDTIWRWNGTAWTQLPGAARWIAAGSASNVWVVNSAGAVYKLNAAGTNWEMPTVPTGQFKWVSVASDGSVLLVKNDGTLWKR